MRVQYRLVGFVGLGRSCFMRNKKLRRGCTWGKIILNRMPTQPLRTKFSTEARGRRICNHPQFSIGTAVYTAVRGNSVIETGTGSVSVSGTRRELDPEPLNVSHPPPSANFSKATFTWGFRTRSPIMQKANRFRFIGLAPRRPHEISAENTVL